MKQLGDAVYWVRVRTRARTIATALMAVSALFLVPGLVPRAAAVTTCVFVTSGTTMTLTGDCATDATIFIPNGFTLDGAGFQITAVDPPLGHFTGAVVQNAGVSASVRHLGVTTSNLANVCDAGTLRLRGIMFDGSAGSILHSTVTNINQGASGCQEGNAIEIRNAPFDGTHPATKTVEVAHNTILTWQKTGIVANGDVNVGIHHNQIGASATQANLAANSVQFGFGATGSLTYNLIDGNQWFGCVGDVDEATAVLLFLSMSVTVTNNNIRGNSDIGIYVGGDNTVVDNNRVFDEGPDASACSDVGIYNDGVGNSFTSNHVRGFTIPYVNVPPGGKNNVIPGPNS